MTCDAQCRELEHLRVIRAVRQALGHPGGPDTDLAGVVDTLKEELRRTKISEEALARAVKASRFKFEDAQDPSWERGAEEFVSYLTQNMARLEDLENENDTMREEINNLRIRLRNTLRNTSDARKRKVRS